MKYEVINISTTSETYIANGYLTHNKPPSSPCPTDSANVQYTLTISFGDDYVPAFPLTLGVGTSYNRIGVDVTNGCKRFEHSDGTSYKEFSITNIGQTFPYGYNINFKRIADTAAGALGYTASAIGIDANNQYASASIVGNTTYTRARQPTSGLTCLSPDTLIEKYDGNTVFLKDIEVGDELLTIDVPSMKLTKTIVTSKNNHTVNKLYLINHGALRCSDSHIHIAKRDNEWQEFRTHELFVNDILLNKNLEEVKISSIDIIN